jgi:hypothetical protein
MRQPAIWRRRRTVSVSGSLKPPGNLPKCRAIQSVGRALSGMCAVIETCAFRLPAFPLLPAPGGLDWFCTINTKRSRPTGNEADEVQAASQNGTPVERVNFPFAPDEMRGFVCGAEDMSGELIHHKVESALRNCFKQEAIFELLSTH